MFVRYHKATYVVILSLRWGKGDCVGGRLEVDRRSKGRARGAHSQEASCS